MKLLALLLVLAACDQDTIAVKPTPVEEKALKKHGYNISMAATELGLSRAALYRRMEKHGL